MIKNDAVVAGGGAIEMELSKTRRNHSRTIARTIAGTIAGTIAVQSLNDLEEMIVKMFVEVPNKGVDAPEWRDRPFNENHYGHKWFIVPIEDLRAMEIIFPLPDVREHYKFDPVEYVSHLLGHPGDGWFLSALKKKDWSTFLTFENKQAAGGGVNSFTVTVHLTEEGMDHIDDIVSLMFQCINMLKTEGPLQWLFE
ncbi:insulin-degrading enzyme, partial [Fopius arisanus]|uniref:Insulin-degrading enzyme n=1 Tax=Fopius arisanus TaxID=64838 RepID=A0A9R1UAV9_9HYME